MRCEEQQEDSLNLAVVRQTMSKRYTFQLNKLLLRPQTMRVFISRVSQRNSLKNYVTNIIENFRENWIFNILLG